MVDCTGLENRQRATVREFESHRLRQSIRKEKMHAFSMDAQCRILFSSVRVAAQSLKLNASFGKAFTKFKNAANTEIKYKRYFSSYNMKH